MKLVSFYCCQSHIITIKCRANYSSLRDVVQICCYTTVDFKVITVPYDPVFCVSVMLPPLNAFYKNHYKLYLAKML